MSRSTGGLLANGKEDNKFIEWVFKLFSLEVPIGYR